MCEHETSSLERIKELSYSCEDEIAILIHDVCNNCGELLNKEVHVFRYDYSMDYLGD